MERDERVKLGVKAKDRITGFEGIVICVSEWLNGCLRITIQPQAMHEGKPVDNQTFDAEQVEAVEVETGFTQMTPSGGPSIAPKRAADPRR